MLKAEIVKKIEEFVYAKPRSVDEVAKHIDKNWRTADRYIEEIEKEYGTISTRVFRGGTRGALKIVYFAGVEKISSSAYQEKLEQNILKAKRKEEFSAFDIYQFVDDKKRDLSVDKSEFEKLEEYAKLISSTKKQIIIYSGNLSLINLIYKNINIFSIFDSLVKRGVSVKILCRVDFDGKDNIEKILSLNLKYGKDLVEVRHDEHPIRALIIDKEILRIKEVREPTGKIKELNKKIFIFYTILDKNWIEWVTRLFWKKYNQSFDAKLRLIELDKVKI